MSRWRRSSLSSRGANPSVRLQTGAGGAHAAASSCHLRSSCRRPIASDLVLPRSLIAKTPGTRPPSEIRCSVYGKCAITFDRRNVWGGYDGGQGALQPAIDFTLKDAILAKACECLCCHQQVGSRAGYRRASTAYKLRCASDWCVRKRV